MTDFLVKNKNYLLAGILILAAFLIFFNFSRADIQGDDAIYSFRAIGYLDYMDSQLQTSPINWFESIPLWSRLSFHDAPPLVFLIQYLFFKLLGVSLFSARLPFALAGVGSVFLLYLLTKHLYNEKVALLASFILAIFTYHTWASRVGYLEPIVLFFILLTFYLFFKALDDPKKFVFFGISLGLTLLTKYTAFFVLPVIFFYLLFKNKKILINKYFILSIVIAVLIFSPVLIYNFKIFQTRGHFDLQLASLLNQDLSDWPGISGGGIAKDYVAQVVNVWKEPGSLTFLPFYVLLLLSLLFMLGYSAWHWQKKRNLFVILVLVFITIEFTLVGPEIRFLSLFNPFLALVLAWSLIELYRKFATIRPLEKFKKIIFGFLIVIIFGFEFFYNLNTNVFNQPIGDKGKHYSVYRLENGGFEQLEEYLIEEVDLSSLDQVSIHSLDDILVDRERDLVGQDLIIYDPNLRWFSSLWYFRRWSVFFHQIFISAADLTIVLPIPPVEWLDHFDQLGVQYIYYIWGQDPKFFGGNATAQDKRSAEILAQVFASQGAEVKNIQNINGQLAFKVYKLKLNE